MACNIAALMAKRIVPASRHNNAGFGVHAAEGIHEEGGAVAGFHVVEVAEVIGADFAEPVAVVEHDGDARDVFGKRRKGAAGLENRVGEEAGQVEDLAAVRVAG